MLQHIYNIYIKSAPQDLACLQKKRQRVCNVFKQRIGSESLIYLYSGEGEFLVNYSPSFKVETVEQAHLHLNNRISSTAESKATINWPCP